MADQKEDKKQQKPGNPGKKRDVSSTTSLGKRRSLKNKRPKVGNLPDRSSPQENQELADPRQHKASTMSDPRTSEYGSQASLLRQPAKNSANGLTKVAILGAAGGIGQPLSLLMMMYSEYVQHLALYDVAHVRGVGADLSHIDRQCRVTTHLGPNELADAVIGAKVIIILAGIAQKPGMTRDDLFGTNAKIVFDLAKVCARVAPEAHLAIVSNPVNSLVPLVYQVYKRILGGKKPQQQQQAQETGAIEKIQISEKSAKSIKSLAAHANLSSDISIKQVEPQQQAQATPQHHQQAQQVQAASQVQQQQQTNQPSDDQADWAKRIFGVTTLDIVRASTLTARSEFFPPDQATGLFKDPAKVSVPVVGGHAGKTIIPLLSKAQPKLSRKKLDDTSMTSRLISSIQEAGIDVLNAKQGAGSATLAMAYAACRFAVSLLRAQAGETNIVECAYVRHKQAIVDNLDYFAMPLLLGKNGYIKAISPLGKLMASEDRMIEEGAKLLKASIVKGEDSAKEQLSFEK